MAAFRPAFLTFVLAGIGKDAPVVASSIASPYPGLPEPFTVVNLPPIAIFAWSGDMAMAFTRSFTSGAQESTSAAEAVTAATFGRTLLETAVKSPPK